MSENLLILGASARAAAYSAQRAGWRPVAADLFADVDLCRLCAATKVTDYPAGFLQAVLAAPRGPWMYTGALENFPELVDQIASDRRLLGNSGEVLRLVRDPERVASVLQKHGLNSARATRDVPGDDKSWLRKPLRSAGGTNITPFSQARDNAATDHDWYYQQFVAGTPCSAVYVAARGRAVLLGATQQLIGTPWLGANGFRYAGSIGPLQLAPDQREVFQRIGDCLAKQFALAGLFGVDAILKRDGVWPVEVNPRYTASVEILERALSINAIDWHVKACASGLLPPVPPTPLAVYGKGIIYASADAVISEDFHAFARQANAESRWPYVADIPQPSSRIKAHHPVTTVFTSAASWQAVERQLKELADTVNQLVDASPVV